MKKIIRSASWWTFWSVTVRAWSSLAINKIIAVYFGSGGIALLGHFQNLTGMITGIPGEGINKGVIKYLSEDEFPETSKKSIVLAGLLLNGVIFMIALACLLLFPKLTDQFRQTFGFAEWLLLFCTPLFFNLLNLLCVAIFNGLRNFRRYAVFSATSIVCSTALVVLALPYENLAVSLMAYGMGQGVAFLITGHVLLRWLSGNLPGKTELRNALLQLSSFIWLGAGTIFFSRLSSFIIREYAMHEFGVVQTGLWEAAQRVSDSYTMIFSATFVAVFYPRVAALVSKPVALKSYLFYTARTVLPMTAAGLVFVYVFRHEVLTLLFNPGFRAAAPLLAFVVMGDFFKFINYLISNLLMAQGRTALFLFLQFFFMMVYFALTYLCAQQWQIEGMAIAFMCSYIFSVVILFFTIRKTLIL